MKLIVICALVLLFLIPLHLVKSLVRDRERYRDEAVSSVLEPLGGKPVFEGFGVAVPYEETVEAVASDGKIHTQIVRRWMLAFPDLWDFSTEVSPFFLTRGIFEIPVFSCGTASSGRFSSVASLAARIQEDAVFWDEALFCMGVSNKKNLTALPEVRADGVLLVPSVEAPEIPIFTGTLFYTLPAEAARNGFDFSVDAALQGGELLSLCPVAADNHFQISSSWTAPGFSGGWLPVSRSVSNEGFSAEWSVAGFSTVFPRILYGPELSERGSGELRRSSESVCVSFITPVDHYQKTMRSVKYAALFLIIPFLAVLILEIFTAVRIHPVQYGLIGFADVVFYLLLLAVSEHLAFSATYWLSAGVVCLLTFFYAAAIFRQLKWGALFAAVQLVMYVFLFGTLQTEDYALLIGTLGLLGIVILLMALTRRVDWYAEKNI